MIAKLKSRGVLYVIGIVINRVVPEFLFRARIFSVFRFGGPAASGLATSGPDENMKTDASFDDGIRFHWCETPSARPTRARPTADIFSARFQRMGTRRPNKYAVSSLPRLLMVTKQ